MMGRVCKHTNLIPVIAKADSLSEEELLQFKQRVQQQLDAAGISCYKPVVRDGDDAEMVEVTRGILVRFAGVATNRKQSRMPFAVIGSNTVLDINGKKTRVRQYPWVTIPVESEDTSDFLALRTMLIRTHMEDIKESLQNMYELYRAEHLIEKQAKTDSGRIDTDMKAHQLKMQKMEQEMLAVFQQKVADKETKLKNSEAEVRSSPRMELTLCSFTPSTKRWLLSLKSNKRNWKPKRLR